MAWHTLVRVWDGQQVRQYFDGLRTNTTGTAAPAAGPSAGGVGRLLAARDAMRPTCLLRGVRGRLGRCHGRPLERQSPRHALAGNGCATGHRSAPAASRGQWRLLAAPRTDPGERNYRTGLLPRVMTSNRQSGTGQPEFRAGQPTLRDWAAAPRSEVIDQLRVLLRGDPGGACRAGTTGTCGPGSRRLALSRARARAARLRASAQTTSTSAASACRHRRRPSAAPYASDAARTRSRRALRARAARGL